MKLFTAILLGVLIALSFGKDTIRTSDTTYIGNTVKVEIVATGANLDKELAKKQSSASLTYDSIAAYSNRDMVRPSVLGAIFSGGALFVGLLTLLYLRWQAKRELRAYLHIRHDTVDMPDPNDRFPQIPHFQNLVDLVCGEPAPNPPPTTYPFRIENFGLTPAHHVLSWGNVIVAETENPNPIVFVETDTSKPEIVRIMSKSPLGPRATTRARFGFSRKPITDEQIFGLRSGHLSIYIYGKIIYRHVFSRKSVYTSFRYIHTLGGNFAGERQIFEPNIGIASQGNEAT